MLFANDFGEDLLVLLLHLSAAVELAFLYSFQARLVGLTGATFYMPDAIPISWIAPPTVSSNWMTVTEYWWHPLNHMSH